MNKDQAVFFLTGILFGLVIGYVAAYKIHRPEGPAQAQGAMAPAGAQTPDAPSNEVLMEQVTQHIADLKQRVAADPQDLEALVELGNMYYDAGKYPEAISYYSRALEISPDNPDVISDLGVSYRRNGEPERAMEMFRRATRIKPDHWQSWLNISIVAMQDLNDLGQAEEALSHVEQSQPDLPHLDELRQLLNHLREQTAKQSS